MKITSANIAKFFAFALLFSLPFTSYAKDQKKEQKEKKNFVVTMTTNFGDIRFMLLNETPIHRDNFVKLVNDKFYEGVLFHRILNHFVIQAGDPATKTDRSEAARANYGEDSTGYMIPAEILPQFHHYRGALGAAREGDDVNPERRSSGTQFYFVQKPADGKPINLDKVKNKKLLSPETIELYTKRGGTPHLDGGYTIFGYVLSGMDVIDQICRLECSKEGRALKEDVEIKSMKLEKIKRTKIDKKQEHYAK